VGCMATKKTQRKVLIYGTVIVVVLGLAFMIIVPDARVAVARRLLPGVCMTEELKTIANLSGMKVEVIYTNCDTLAKEDSVSVYVSKAHDGGESWFARWSNQRTLIFSYVPGRSNTPSIKLSGDERILISIPDVSSIYFQGRKWRNMSIEYNIGRIYYPQENR
jgi:hypothetical protein